MFLGSLRIVAIAHHIWSVIESSSPISISFNEIQIGDLDSIKTETLEIDESSH